MYKKGCNRLIRIFFILLMFWSGTYAENSLQDWGYARPILTEGRNKYKSFFLDEKVYGHAMPGLVDLRITDNSGEFVPFYIQSGYMDKIEGEIRHDSSVWKVFTKKGDTYFDFRVNDARKNTDIQANRLILSLPAENFLKKVDIYGSYDGIKWEFLCSDTVYRVGSLVRDEISLGGVEKFGYYRIKIIKNIEKIGIERLVAVYSYIQRHRHDYQKKAAAAYRIKNENKTTRIMISNPHRLKIKKIYFTVKGNFQRIFRVRIKNMDAYDVKMIKELYQLEFQETRIADTELDFTGSPIFAESIEVEVENRDDRPLIFENISVDYYIDKLIFADTGKGPYKLYFGNPGASTPSYDIRLYKSYIEQEKQDLCKLGELETFKKTKKQEKGFRPETLLNIVVNGVALLLIGLLISKLNLKKGGEN